MELLGGQLKGFNLQRHSLLNTTISAIRWDMYICSHLWKWNSILQLPIFLPITQNLGHMEECEVMNSISRNEWVKRVNYFLQLSHFGIHLFGLPQWGSIQATGLGLTDANAGYLSRRQRNVSGVDSLMIQDLLWSLRLIKTGEDVAAAVPRPIIFGQRYMHCISNCQD